MIETKNLGIGQVLGGDYFTCTHCASEGAATWSKGPDRHTDQCTYHFLT